MKASRPHWIRDNLLNVIVQMGLDKLADLPDVPSALDLVTDPEKKQVLELILIRQEPGRPVAGAARRAGGPAGGAAQGVRRHDEGPGFRRRGREAAAGDRAAYQPAQIDELFATAYATPKPIVQQAAALVEPGQK